MKAERRVTTIDEYLSILSQLVMQARLMPDGADMYNLGKQLIAIIQKAKKAHLLDDARFQKDVRYLVDMLYEREYEEAYKMAAILFEDVTEIYVSGIVTLRIIVGSPSEHIMVVQDMNGDIVNILGKRFDGELLEPLYIGYLG